MHRKVKHRGRGDTVKQYNQRAHNEEKKNKGPRDICEMENKKRKKSFWKPFQRERQETKEKKRRQSVRSIPKNGSCMQTGNKKQKSTFTLQHGWPLMYITSNSNRTPPLTYYSIGRVQNANRKIKENQRECIRK